MKYLKTYESIYESPYVIELKDMALELSDMGFTVQVFKDQHHQACLTDKNILVVITRPNNFTMTDDVKDFILRAIGYMKDNDFHSRIHSNYGTIHQAQDGRLFVTGHTLGKKFPSLSMINLIFTK